MRREQECLPLWIQAFLLITALIVFLTVITLTGCTTDVPRITKIGETTIVQTDKRFCGAKINTETKEIKTKEQKLEDLEIQKKQREQDIDLDTEERQKVMAFWFGVALLGFVPVCVVLGYVLQGWKFWGGLAAISGFLGGAFWSFEHLVPFLKWPAFELGPLLFYGPCGN